MRLEVRGVNMALEVQEIERQVSKFLGEILNASADGRFLL